jgi:putative flippase GtrA
MVSTLCALTFSYFMNKRFVFKHHGKFDVKSAVLFLSVTLFGLWIIQGLGMVLLIDVTKTINPSLYANHPYLVTNVAKLAASFVSIVWNFVLYNSVVFKNEPKK